MFGFLLVDQGAPDLLQNPPDLVQMFRFNDILLLKDNRSTKPEPYVDKVYIDGPCELFIRRYIDSLLADSFCNQEFPGPIALLKFEFGNSRA